jgi:uncharacterized protein
MDRATGLAAISLDDLERYGIRGIIIDLDNTLVAYRAASVSPDVTEWIERARNRGFRLVLVSNNWSDRVATFGSELGIPTVPSAMKPMPLAFLRALRALGTSRKQTVVVGDQLFTDVLGAAILGIRAILTEPISEHGFITTRAMRVVERLLLRWARR